MSARRERPGTAPTRRGGTPSDRLATRGTSLVRHDSSSSPARRSGSKAELHQGRSADASFTGRNYGVGEPGRHVGAPHPRLQWKNGRVDSRGRRREPCDLAGGRARSDDDEERPCCEDELASGDRILGHASSGAQEQRDRRAIRRRSRWGPAASRARSPGEHEPPSESSRASKLLLARCRSRASHRRNESLRNSRSSIGRSALHEETAENAARRSMGWSAARSPTSGAIRRRSDARNTFD